MSVVYHSIVKRESTDSNVYLRHLSVGISLIHLPESDATVIHYCLLNIKFSCLFPLRLRWEDTMGHNNSKTHNEISILLSYYILSTNVSSNIYSCLDWISTDESTDTRYYRPIYRWTANYLTIRLWAQDFYEVIWPQFLSPDRNREQII